MALIHEKIFNIQKDMPTLQKNGTGPQAQGSYKFLAVDDILAAVKPLLDREKVIVIPSLLDKGFHYNAAADKNDGRVPRESVQAWVEYDFAFVAVEDGSEIHSVVIAEGIDTQDKALRKATTSAWKIALIQTFALITGEQDPDAQNGAYEAQETVPTASPAQRKIDNAKATTLSSNDTDGNLAKLKADFKAAGIARGLNSDEYMKFGDAIAKRDFQVNDRKQWTGNAAIIQAGIKALEAGEVVD